MVVRYGLGRRRGQDSGFDPYAELAGILGGGVGGTAQTALNRPSDEAIRRIAELAVGTAYPNAAMGVRRTTPGQPTAEPGRSIEGLDTRFQESLARRVLPEPPGIGAGAAGVAESVTPSVFDELLALQDPSRYMMDEASLRRQAQQAAGAQYNPIIRALQQQQESARGRAETYDERLAALFGGLEESIEEDIPGIEREYKRGERETRGEFEQLRESIGGQYKQSQQEQEEMLKRLNIEAAAPGILPEQMADRDYFTGRAREMEETATQALEEDRRGDVGFARAGTQIARLSGAEHRADLTSQLEELVQGLESQVAANRAARGQATEAGFTDLQSQASQQAAQQAQQEFQNRMAMLQYERQLQQDEFSQLQALQEAEQQPTEVESYRDIVPAALEFVQPRGGGRREAQNIAEVMNTILDDPSVGLDPFTGARLNSYQLAQKAMEEGQRRGLGPVQLAALRQIAQEYF